MVIDLGVGLGHMAIQYAKTMGCESLQWTVVRREKSCACLLELSIASMIHPPRTSLQRSCASRLTPRKVLLFLLY